MHTNLAAEGQAREHTDVPTSMVHYNPATNEYSASVYNPTDAVQTVTVYQGTTEMWSFEAAPRVMTTDRQTR